MNPTARRTDRRINLSMENQFFKVDKMIYIAITTKTSRPISQDLSENTALYHTEGQIHILTAVLPVDSHTSRSCFRLSENDPIVEPD